MKIYITENQLRKLYETVTDDKVICDECGWSWDLSEGGDDPYVCHKCGHDNSQDEFIGKKLWCITTYINIHFQ